MPLPHGEHPAGAVVYPLDTEGLPQDLGAQKGRYCSDVVSVKEGRGNDCVTNKSGEREGLAPR